MDFRELIRHHVYNRKNFYELSVEQKRDIASFAINSDEFDSYDMMMQIDGKTFNKLIFDHVIEKNISADDVIKDFLDNIIKQWSSKFDEIFDEELEEFQNNYAESLDY